MTAENRVRRLEWEVRWTRVGGVVMAVALACIVLVGAGQDQEKSDIAEKLEARSIVVCDDSGRECINLAPGGIFVHGYSKTKRTAPRMWGRSR